MNSVPSWEKLLGVPKPPSCNLMAACCSVATPSVPVAQLFEQAGQGDETSRDFLSVFIPHASHQAARDFYPVRPDHIDTVLDKVRAGAVQSGLGEQDVVFYHCRYLDAGFRCQVYEDRPTFCRDYPASPMAILVKGCGYEDWVARCKAILAQAGYEIVDNPPL